jgi:hypothetical protein
MNTYRRLIATLTLACLAAMPGLASARSPGPVVISEIAWIGTAASANEEWIELYNNSAAPMSLTSWGLVAADDTPSQRPARRSGAKLKQHLGRVARINVRVSEGGQLCSSQAMNYICY